MPRNHSNSDLKREVEVKLVSLREKRKKIISDFKKKIEQAKINEIQKSL